MKEPAHNPYAPPPAIEQQAQSEGSVEIAIPPSRRRRVYSAIVAIFAFLSLLTFFVACVQTRLRGWPNNSFLSLVNVLLLASCFLTSISLATTSAGIHFRKNRFTMLGLGGTLVSMGTYVICALIAD